MKYVLYLLTLLAATDVFSQAPQTNEKKTAATEQRFILQYDPNTLRIPGKSLPIGIITISGKGDTLRTNGFLGGAGGWGKFKVEVEGGSYGNGRIKIGGTGSYKQSDSITVQVYTRKSFLGGKDKWLLTRKIPYNYETAINIITSGNFSKAPGDHVQFGVRTWYDNKMFVDKWFPAGKNLLDFTFKMEGGHISKSKGDLKIENDPVKITNDKVSLVAILAKHPAITDTLRIMLDYIAKYQCKIQSEGQGHNLAVAADVYFDSIINAKLMRVVVNDSSAKKRYNYLVNTNGGSITISSAGAGGISGRDGWDGLTGTPGTPGGFTTKSETVVGPDGNLQTITTTVEGAGGDGGRGGEGENGDVGGPGYDGGNITVSYTLLAQPFLALIKAISIPGPGGSGGRAGRGGSGGLGGSGNPGGNTGPNGNDGFSGSEGREGAKGKIVFVPGNH